MTPFHLFINFPFICSFTGVTPQEYFGDPKTMLDAQVETFQRLKLPVCLVADYGLATECSAFGAPVKYDNMGFPSVEGTLLPDLEAAGSWDVPDPWSAGLMPKVLHTMEYMKEHAPAGARLEVSPVSAPFNTAAMLRGISDFCLDLAEEEEEVIHDFLNLVTDSITAYLKAQEQIAGEADCIMVCDDVSSFVSPAAYSEFVLPTYERLYSAFPNARRWLHNDARAAHIAPLVAKAGFECWHIGDCIDMEKALEDTQGRVKLIGNMSPKLMRTGTAEEVKAEAQRMCSQYGQSDAFVAGVGGFINYGTPVENVEAFISVFS